MTARVLILDGSIWPEIYRPADQWRALIPEGIAADSAHLPSGEPVPDLGAYTHVIVSGSEASISRPEPWFEVEADAVRRAFDMGLPILGSCFGHQMLAVALSGPDRAAPSPTPELGWAPIEVLAEDDLLDGLPRPFHTFVCHFDEVRDPPRPWRVLARSAGCAVQIMRWGSRPVWGVQAHPEICPEDGLVLLEGFLEKAPERGAIVRAALSQEPRDDRVAREIARRFLAASPTR